MLRKDEPPTGPIGEHNLNQSLYVIPFLFPVINLDMQET